MNVVEYGRIFLGANLPNAETSTIKAFEKKESRLYLRKSPGEFYNTY